ncbi:hypothetical protein D9613_012467 [Agrocybe pediades]|uniref:Uncharacterized protein n=1 Tax=Agrocybe pediades TaxID=84607 RepID=A0A8H4QR83_9AGAR|nr:hypothetical protein D9613_012467 [Agrocybe pediades]
MTTSEDLTMNSFDQLSTAFFRGAKVKWQHGRDTGKGAEESVVDGVNTAGFIDHQQVTAHRKILSADLKLFSTLLIYGILYLTRSDCGTHARGTRTRLIKRREKQCAKEAAKASKSAAAPASASGAGAKAAAGPFDADLTPNYSGGEGVVPDGTKLDDVDESLAGRIRNIRPSGSKLIFYHLHGEGVKVQIFAAQ